MGETKWAHTVDTIRSRSAANRLTRTGGQIAIMSQSSLKPAIRKIWPKRPSFDATIHTTLHLSTAKPKLTTKEQHEIRFLKVKYHMKSQKPDQGVPKFARQLHPRTRPRK